MKIVKQIIATLMILVLIGLSGVGIFGLSSTNVDNKKAAVALVNEDAGASVQGTDIRYGDDFIKLFVQNRDANYEVTTRTSGQNGLDSGKYDLMIIVPKTFTQKAITYDATEPERAYLEYAKSSKLSQSESFKADLVSRVLKETANKTLIETFTLGVLKTMQGMQGKSLEIIENEMKYQKAFKDGVEKPMTDAMTNFNSSLSALVSQQGLLDHFDSSVKSFESSVKGQSEAEQKHMQDLAEQRKRYEETKDMFSKWNTSYSETLKGMKESNAVSNLIEAQKLRKASAEELIENLKLNAVQLEYQIKKISDYEKELGEISAAYDGVAKTGVIPADINGNTVDGKKLLSLKNQVDKVFAPDSKSTANLSNAINSMTQTTAQKTKEEVENSLTAKCNELPEDAKSLPKEKKELLDETNNYCSKVATVVTPAPNLPKAIVSYQFQKNIKVPLQNADFTMKIVGNDITVKYKDDTTGKWENLTVGKEEVLKLTSPQKTVDLEVTFTHTQELDDITNIPTYTPNGQYTVLVTPKGQSPEENEMNFGALSGSVDKEVLAKYQKVEETLTEINALGQVYYGKTLKELTDDYTADRNKTILPSDKNITRNTNNITRFRPYAKIVESGEKAIVVENGQEKQVASEWTGSLIARAEKIYDYTNLKTELTKELTKAFAEELKKNVDEVKEKMNNYVQELKKLTSGTLDETKIYKDETKTELKEPLADYYIAPTDSTPKGSLDVTIDLAIKQHEETSNLLTNLTTFDSNFQSWLNQYDTISGKTGEITKLHEDEGKISVQLEESQQQLLTGVDSLQKSIIDQLESTQHIISDAAKLKTDAEGSKKKIEENTEKLNATKKKFDETVKDNSGFVNDFIRKYVSAQSGGADNQLFYQNFVNPVAITEKASSNSNNLTSFFTILMVSLFSLVIARFFNEYRRGFIGRKLKSEHGVGNIFAGVTLELGFVAIASVIAAVVVSFIGLQAISDSVSIDKALVYTIVGAGLVAMTYAFSVILFGFKKYGTQIILAFIALYFLTNGALGLALVKNDSFSWLRAINPLGYMENILQSVFLTQVASVQTLLIVLGVVAVVSVVSIYFLQPLMYKQKQSE